MNASPLKPSLPAKIAEHYARIEATELPASIPVLLERAARLYQDRPAIDFFEDGAALTFRELFRQVRKLAHGLQQTGIEHGSHVAVLMPNRIEYPLTWLALAELGAVMVPVITSLTRHELDFILQDAEVSYLIVDASLAEQHRAYLRDNPHLPPNHVIIVGAAPSAGELSFEQIMESGDIAFTPSRRPEARDLLSIQYTSGTTGMPKGVMQSHRFWIVAGCLPALLWSDITRILSDHPFHYIDPQWMLLMGLYGGARVDFTKGMSVRRFVQWLHTRGSELAWFPDPLLHTPASAEDATSAAKLFLAYHFSPEMVRTVEARYGSRVREAYGMTEISLGLTVPYESTDPNAIGTCGFPAPLRECRIVDTSGRDAPQGVVGELWIRGDGILDGYYKRPEENARCFVEGWFRTGDLFIRDEHGYYRIVGRLKDMIRRNAENISALEVEQALTDMPQIARAAVVPVPDAEREEEVKAYVQLREGLTAKDVPPQAILQHCSERLAKFKLPRYIAYVDGFEHTASDKIAKHLLVKGVADLRAGAFDLVENRWH